MGRFRIGMNSDHKDSMWLSLEIKLDGWAAFGGKAGRYHFKKLLP